MSGPLGSSQWMYASGYEIEQSLRFEDGNDAYLAFRPAAAGNRKTWTFSCWVKRGNLANGSLFACNSAGSDAGYTRLAFHDNSSLIVTGNNTVWRLTDGTQHFRDISAWYHIVCTLDTTQGTAANRLKLWVNGSQLSQFSHNNNPDQNDDLGINTAAQHHIGSAGNEDSPTVEFDGLMAEVHFIDGTAKAASDFGEEGTYGEWKPKEYGGSHGTNGFYLDFKQDSSVEGFSVVNYKGTGGDGVYVGGVGFTPDLVWIKRRNGNGSHRITDAVRGANVDFSSDDHGAEATGNNCESFESDGFTVDGNSSDSGDSYSAWCWDMGGSNANNTDGTINSVVRANSTYGQSIVSYTGTGSNATVGHGLSEAPDMIIVKARTEPTGGTHFGSDQGNWVVYHSAIAGDAETDYMLLNSTAAAADSAVAWQDTAPTSSVFSISTVVDLNESSDTYIAYCFHDVTGYSKFGNYTGDGTSDGSKSVDLGFTPAWVMIKCTNDAESWWVWDNANNALNTVSQNRIALNASGAETTNIASGADNILFTDDGFKFTGTGGGSNQNNNTYIYAAFADKRDYGFWQDASGNNNDFIVRGLDESDIMLDTPSNNFAVMSPITPRTVNTPTVTFSEANTKVYMPIYSETYSNMYPTTGKWYYEVLIADEVYAQTIYGAAVAMDSNRGNTGGSIGYHSGNGNSYILGTDASYGNAFTDGDIVGVALNLDDNAVTFYKNNSTQGTISNELTAGVGYGLMIGDGRNDVAIVNFGQDSSFAAVKVPQGNKDGNGKGDFYYTPPSGFVAMCTSNLPTPTITSPAENFNTVLYTGTGSSNAITGVGFQPEMTMISERDESEAVPIVDILRSNTVELNISATAAQSDDAQKITAIGSDGFTVGTSAAANQNGNAHVSYHWKFGGSGSANSDGSVSSTVTVNSSAGMSIVKYEGTGSATTVGHGLGAVPKMMWIKNIDRVKAWTFYHVGLGNTHSLSQTDAGKYDEDNRFNDTTPTSSVFSIGDSDETNYNGDDHIAYCFAEVDGFSRIGKYKGNGSADGTFVYTGFRPAWVFIKSTAANREPVIFDNKRNGYNVTNEGMSLRGYAETTNYGILDLLSNGFKLRATTNHTNEDGTEIVYIAFAEMPFKWANAR